ncbi:MAG: hypothetical protein R6U97_01250 [Desulfosalsimonas sp.]
MATLFANRFFLISARLSPECQKMQGQKRYARISLEKGQSSELAELASDLL